MTYPNNYALLLLSKIVIFFNINNNFNHPEKVYYPLKFDQLIS